MSCAGPSGDRRVIPTIDLLLDPVPVTHHRHCDGLPRRMDHLFELIGSPRGERVREFYALRTHRTRDFRQLFVQILDATTVVHRSGTAVHRNARLSTGLSTVRGPTLWTTVSLGRRPAPTSPLAGRPLRTPAAACPPRGRPAAPRGRGRQAATRR